MLISELIKELQAAKRKYGDLPCATANEEFGTYSLLRRTSYQDTALFKRGHLTQAEFIAITTE